MTPLPRKYLHIVCTLFLSVFLLLPSVVSAAQVPEHPFPRLANYFLHWSIDDYKAQELAAWDLLILDMETQITSRRQLERIRELNPNVVMLAYITPQEIRADAAVSGSVLRQKLAAQLHSDWYLVDTNGTRLSWWPGTQILNVSSKSPLHNGKQLHSFMAEFVVDELLSTGLWDGVFYDNAWDSISWFAGDTVDLDRDGAPDADADIAWVDGMKALYNETRTLTGNEYIIVGNGLTRAYRNELNGSMLENFRGGAAWAPTMNTYAYYHQSGPAPRIQVINGNTDNTGNLTDYQNVRFGLASTLLGDGYFSFDYGDQDHGQLWWYDEYNINLGQARTDAVETNGVPGFFDGVWTRLFQHGIAVLNSSNETQRIQLGTEYEAITGSQDPVANNGAISDELILAPQDGRILLLPIGEEDDGNGLLDVVIPNGAFTRFLSARGDRVRNGVFVFDEAYDGGVRIMRTDMDGNGKRELFLITHNRIRGWRDDGQILMNVYPYTVQYTGELRVAFGDLEGDGKKEIMVAPSESFGHPLKLYTRHGRQKKRDWFPISGGYTGGYHLAFGNLDGESGDELLLATHELGKGYIHTYAYSWPIELTESRLIEAYGPSLAPPAVTVGKFLPGDTPQIATVRGKGQPPEVRFFSPDGESVGESYQAFSSRAHSGVFIDANDMNFDGRDDVLIFSNDLGL